MNELESLAQHFGITVHNGSIRAFAIELVDRVFSKASIEGCNFYHNQPNDYSAITMTFFTGKGDSAKFRGAEQVRQYWNGFAFEPRPSGYYDLNSDFAAWLVDSLQDNC